MFRTMFNRSDDTTQHDDTAPDGAGISPGMASMDYVHNLLHQPRRTHATAAPRANAPDTSRGRDNTSTDYTVRTPDGVTVDDANNARTLTNEDNTNVHENRNNGDVSKAGANTIPDIIGTKPARAIPASASRKRTRPAFGRPANKPDACTTVAAGSDSTADDGVRTKNDDIVARVYDSRHALAKGLKPGDYFVVASPGGADNAGHDFWLARCVGRLQYLRKAHTDAFQNKFSAGSAVIRAHWLDWQKKGQKVYMVDTNNQCYIYSHLVCTGPVAMHAVGRSKTALTLANEEVARCIAAVSSD